MDVREDQLLVVECDNWMQRALDRGICLDGSGLNGILEDFESALEFMPNCAPILDCCSMLNFMLEKKSEAREYRIRASRNEHGFVSETTREVCRLVWIEFMKWTIYKPLIGKRITVKYEEKLPGLPPQFRSGGDTNDPQVFKGDFHFSVAVVRIADNVELTLTLEHAEIGVSNFMETDDFQGYFPHAYEIDVSPFDSWSGDSTLLKVRREGCGQTSLPTHQQRVAGYNVGFALSAPSPSANASINSTHGVSSSKFGEGMTASRGNDKAMRMTWKVNTYEEGKPFKVKTVRKINKLPHSPSNHVCNDSFKFQGTWAVPLNIAGGLQYDFRWKICLTAHSALLLRKSRVPSMSAPDAPTHEHPPNVKVEMSDFYSTSMERIFHF